LHKINFFLQIRRTHVGVFLRLNIGKFYFFSYKVFIHLNLCRLDDCSPTDSDRYQASLLKSNDRPASPLYTSQRQGQSQTTANSLRSPASSEGFTDSTISLAKVATIPRCRHSIISNTIVPSQPTYNSLSTENSHAVVSPSLTFVAVPTNNDDTKMTSFFQPISIGNPSPVSYSEIDGRKNSSRLPLEAVPELSELTVANSRYSYAQSMTSTVHIPHHPRSAQPSPVLITFDSSSLKRRT
jgi:hypothetical protein